MGWSTIKMLLALKCDESTRLLSDALDRDLPFVERWAVRLHAISCRSCCRFRRQMLILRKAIQNRVAMDPDEVANRLQLSDEARKRISRAIAGNSSEDSF
jgi:hypothetical protein